MHPPNAPSTALRVTGRDALPVLHRVTSQALLDLPVGFARATLFCDFRGRVVQRAVVAHAPDGAVWLLRDGAAPADLIGWIERSVFREDVVVEDHSGRLGFGRVADNGPAGARFDASGPLRVATGDGTALVRGAPPMTDTERVSLGLAAHHHEIVEEFNPYEIGLGADVHLDKGCYTGQEALQRLITYRSVRRQLVRVTLPPGPPAPDGRIHDDEGEAGLLTTVADPAPGGEVAALAVIRIASLDRGAALSLADGRPLRVQQRLDMPRPLGRP